MSPIDVLVVGAGKRVQGALLPALCCLPERFRVAAIVSRKPHDLAYGAQRFTTVTSLDGVDLSRIGLAVVAVTLGSVPAVLRQLGDMRHAALMLDTPVLALRHLAAARSFRAWKRVVVAEDNVALPPFLVARTLIDAGAIGELQRIYFFHNGYKYHALSALKMLARSHIRSIVNHKFKDVRRKDLVFANGVTAAMYEPRDYKIGKFLLEGTRGAIADYDHPAASHRIGYVVDGDHYQGLTLDGARVPDGPFDAAYRTHTAGVSILNASPMNTMKLRGMLDLYAGAVEEHSPYHYGPGEAIEDAVAITLADRVGYVHSPHLAARLVDALS